MIDACSGGFKSRVSMTVETRQTFHGLFSTGNRNQHPSCYRINKNTGRTLEEVEINQVWKYSQLFRM